MCRFVIYKGTDPVQLSHLLTRPCHSIINQAFDSRLRLDRRRPINGDGFGVGWYDSVHDEELGSQPCIFTSVTPAWNNVNLLRLAEKIKSPLVFAHVRATTAGTLSLDNCHPWSYGKLMFMHNGGIADFHKIKRKLQMSVRDEVFDWLPDPMAKSFTPGVLQRTMLETIAHINALTEEYGITEPSLMNFCVSDGETVVATRYISSRTDEAASLWFSSGSTFSEYAEGGHYKMSKTDKRENLIMIASEPLTFEKADWMEIRTNHMVVITPKMNLLQIPIVDKFYVTPSDPAALNRGVEFAAAKGLLSPILIFLPLTLSTLSRSAFLLLSLLLFLHSLIHGTLVLLWGSPMLSIMQVPMHPFLLLVCFNAFSEGVHPWLTMAATWWGRILQWSSPGFIVMEGLSSLLVAQKLGQVGKELVGEGEVYQFGLLIAAAAAYVTSSFWIVVSYPATADSPLSSTLLGVALTTVIFLTFIGFALRRTNVIESSCLALIVAYNIWLCGVDDALVLDPGLQ
ncbi:hypothetical protein GSI_06591 [Ganoderma sinense ZZ0214-1]|uniref:Glutamine amidotransferase type-2 domain-containing protein n=1 Tax=Ganoderma sinense ZZ0214-1 TaxID=1077348 RepID=A0A2G8SDU2_9APHY|nr:hypothetical protein GSI_06591 [Ganoderma sinense ZZ0214-1]